MPRGTLLHVILLSPAVSREQQVIMSSAEEPGGRLSREVVVDLQLTFMDEGAESTTTVTCRNA